MGKWMDGYLEKLAANRRENFEAGGQERIELQHQLGKLTARERIELLADPGTFEEMGSLVREFRFGLDELSLEGGAGGIEESALVLGKYLNPDLYLGYSQGLFNPEGAVLLRLRLTERLEVESRSGNEQSFDLFYRLEHD